MSDFNRARFFHFLPEGQTLGWTPHAWLVFLPVLFVQPALQPTSAIAWAWFGGGAALFVASYFRVHWASGQELRAHVVFQAALGVALSPVNPGAYVLFTYAASAGARARRTREAIAWILGVAAIGVGAAAAAHAPFSYSIGDAMFTLLIGGVSLQRAQTDRANERLRVANEEIERLAAIAERERIARDLHDLLGHTLSLIVLKSELASRLAERDVTRAVREIRDVETVSRAALEEVRDAIRGFRPRLDTELARARQLLNTGGISVVVDWAIASDDFTGWEPVAETLALALREAATNIARHSGARRATIRAWRNPSPHSLHLELTDDGVGGRVGAPNEGNGLRGMRERIEALSGTLTVDAAHTGTRLTVALPLRAVAPTRAALRVVGA